MGLGGSPDDLILDCYWLARWYHQCPDVFLNMPISQVQRHIARTHQMMMVRKQAEDAEDA